MPRLTNYPSLREVLNAAYPVADFDPLTSITEPSTVTGAWALTLDDEGYRIDLTVRPMEPDGTYRATFVAHYTGNTRFPESVVQRFNTLLRADGISLRPNWRSGAHDLRVGPGERAPLGPDLPVELHLTGAVLGNTPSTSTSPPSLPPSGVTLPPRVDAGNGSPSPAEHSTDERGAFAGEPILSPEVSTGWAEADHLHQVGLPAHLLMQGPPGTGKTHIARWFGRSEGRKVIEHNCYGMREPGDWFGQVGFSDGATRFTPSALYWALTLPGPRLLILDEVNRATEQAMNALMPVLGGQDTFVLPHDGHPIAIAPDLKVVMTANVGTYSGVNQMDRALRDRQTVIVKVDYLPTVDEERLLVERMAMHGLVLQAWQASTLVRFAAQSRQMALSGDLTPVSTRQLLAAAAVATLPGKSLLDAVRRTILTAYDDEAGEQSEAAVIATIVAGIDWTEPVPPDEADEALAAAVMAAAFVLDEEVLP